MARASSHPTRRTPRNTRVQRRSNPVGAAKPGGRHAVRKGIARQETPVGALPLESIALPASFLERGERQPTYHELPNDLSRLWYPSRQESGVTGRADLCGIGVIATFGKARLLRFTALSSSSTLSREPRWTPPLRDLVTKIRGRPWRGTLYRIRDAEDVLQLHAEALTGARNIRARKLARIRKTQDVTARRRWAAQAASESRRPRRKKRR